MEDCRVIGDVLLVHLPREIDHHSGERIQKSVDRQLRTKKIARIVFDFSQTEFMDSAGIGILLGRYKRMKERGGDAAMYGVSARIARLLRIAGMDKLIRCCRDFEQARKEGRHGCISE